MKSETDACYWMEGIAVANWTFVNNVVKGVNQGPCMEVADVYIGNSVPVSARVACCFCHRRCFLLCPCRHHSSGFHPRPTFFSMHNCSTRQHQREPRVRKQLAPAESRDGAVAGRSAVPVERRRERGGKRSSDRRPSGCMCVQARSCKIVTCDHAAARRRTAPPSIAPFSIFPLHFPAIFLLIRAPLQTTTAALAAATRCSKATRAMGGSACFKAFLDLIECCGLLS